MENLKSVKQVIKCPKCKNMISAKVQSNGYIKGTCRICKSTIITKKHSNETLIKIVSNA